MTKMMPSDSVLKPGRWCKWTVDGVRYVSVGCPECGECSTLEHQVSHAGVVSQPVACEADGCTFHDEVMLLGWAPVS